jgi:hypothetical protein
MCSNVLSYYWATEILVDKIVPHGVKIDAEVGRNVDVEAFLLCHRVAEVLEKGVEEEDAIVERPHHVEGGAPLHEPHLRGFATESGVQARIISRRAPSGGEDR